jgi:tyrosyl-tRNA synthetase
LKRFEFRNNEKYKEIEDKIINMRAYNDKFSSELKKKMEDLDSQWNKMIEFKNDILEKFDKNITEIQTERIDLKKENDLFKSDFKEMKDKFNEMSEFFKNKEIKENRHRSKSIYSKGNSNNFHRFNIQDNTQKSIHEGFSGQVKRRKVVYRICGYMRLCRFGSHG